MRNRAFENFNFLVFSIKRNLHLGMNSFEMSSQMEYFKVLSYVMIAIGQWDFKEKKGVHFRFIYKHFLSKLVFYHFLLMSQFFLLTIVVWKDCKSRILEHISVYFQFMNTNITTLILKKSPKIQEVIKYMLEYEKNAEMSSKMKVLYLKNAKLNNKITIRIAMLIIFVTAYWLFSTVR